MAGLQPPRQLDVTPSSPSRDPSPQRSSAAPEKTPTTPVVPEKTPTTPMVQEKTPTTPVVPEKTPSSPPRDLPVPSVNLQVADTSSNAPVSRPGSTAGDYTPKAVPKPRRKEGSKAEDFQVYVGILEARQLPGNNIDTRVCAQIGMEKQFTKVVKSTTAPHYDEQFVFDFRMPADKMYDQMLTITVFQLRKFLQAPTVLGTFSLDIRTIYEQPDHVIYKKWAMLTDENDSTSGFAKCTLTVSSKDEPAKIPSKPAVEIDEIVESNLLLPAGVQMNRTYAKYSFKIYKAEGLSQTSSGVMAGMKRVFSDAKREVIDPFVEISFGGQTAKTTVKTETSRPTWNETLVFTELFPPLIRRVRIQVLDASGAISTTISDSTPIGTHFVDFASVCGEGDDGFLPTFGPSYINLYGGTRDPSVVSDKQTEELNAGVGEGCAYRGRLLVALSVELLNMDTGRTAPISEPCLPFAESELGKEEEFFLFCNIADASMLDRRLASQKLQLELSLGNTGNVIDVVPPEPPEKTKPKFKSATTALKPFSKDGHENFLPFGGEKPILFIKETFPDQRRRLYNINALRSISTVLSDAIEIAHKCLDLDDYDQQITKLVDELENLGAECGAYLALLKNYSGQNAGVSKLDRERFRLCEREVEAILSWLKNITPRTLSKCVSETLSQMATFSTRLQSLAIDPQGCMPDIFVWLVCGARRIAYGRFPAADIIWSANHTERGQHCGVMQSVFMKVPRGRQTAEEANQLANQVSIYFWLGVNKQRNGILDGIPRGYEQSKEITSIEDPQCFPPQFLTYKDKLFYELRCHLYQAKAVIGSDESGFSDPYAKIIFEGHSTLSQVIKETLNPMWDETLVIQPIELYGLASDIRRKPPNVMVQIYDEDLVGKDEFLGQVVAKCVVKVLDEPYEPPRFPSQLRWYTVERGEESAGELLASFELLQMKSADADRRALPPLPRKTVAGTSHPLYRIPEGIRPILCKYRLEVLFWGLRDLKRINLTTVDRPRIDVDCAGYTLSSVPILNYQNNPNFDVTVEHIDIDLPENPSFWPPIVVRCVDCKTFGRFVLVGSHTVSDLDCFLYKPKAVERIEEVPEIAAPSSAGQAPVPALEARRASSSVVIDVEAAQKKDDIEGKKKKKKKKEEDDDFQVLDWWSKYYATTVAEIIEGKIEEKLVKLKKPKSKEGKPEGVLGLTVWGVKNLRNALQSSKSTAQTVELKKKKKKSKFPWRQIAKMTMFDTELEKVPEFEEFEDFVDVMKLYRGKQGYDEIDDEERCVGKFKGKFAVGKYPLPPQATDCLFGAVPSNSPVTILVRVYIVKAVDLHPADVNGKADPYIYITLGTTEVSDKDNYVPKQLNPVFGRPIYPRH